MNHSSDPDKIIGSLEKAGVLTLLRHNKHKTYQISPEHRKDPKEGLFYCSISPSDWRAPRKVRSELRRKLKPGVLEKVMGWTNPKDDPDHESYKDAELTEKAIGIIETANKGKIPVPSTVDLSKIRPSQSRVSSDSIVHAAQADKTPQHLVPPEETMQAVHSVRPTISMAPPPPPEPVKVETKVEPPTPPPIKVEPKPLAPIAKAPSSPAMPEKVRVESSNPHAKLLAEMINSSIDRVEALKKGIEEREQNIRRVREEKERIINSLQELNNKESKELKESLEYIEQLNLTLIAVPETTVEIRRPDPIHVEKPATAAAPQVPDINDHRKIAEIIGKVLAKNPDRCFTSAQILKMIQETGYIIYGKDGRQVVSNVLSVSIRNGWAVTYRQHERGLYTHNS